MVVGLILVIFGAIFLLAKVGIFTAPMLDYVWPSVLILIGLLILSCRVYGRRYSTRLGCCCIRQDGSGTDQK